MRAAELGQALQGGAGPQSVMRRYCVSRIFIPFLYSVRLALYLYRPSTGRCSGNPTSELCRMVENGATNLQS